MNNCQRVLITGAGGFVGRAIVDALLHNGLQVIALDQAFDPDLRATWQAFAGPAITLIEGDMAQLPDDSPIDAVVHGAAVTASASELNQDPVENFRANLDPWLAVLDWAQKMAVKRVVGVSSSAVYQETAPGPILETQPTTPLGMYATAKTTMENMAQTLRTFYNRDVTMIRLSNIYGPGERTRVSRPRVSLIGGMISEAVQTQQLSVSADTPARDWTLAPDIGQAVAALLAAPHLSHPLYHVAAEQVVTPLQIAEEIKKHLPDVTLKITGQSPQPAGNKRLGYLSNARLHEDVGFDGWTDLATGLGQSIDWFKQATHRSSLLIDGENA
ncbi:NAD-dependent epimerase/dehydratase family protein [Chloroflexota bacterium]